MPNKERYQKYYSSSKQKIKRNAYCREWYKRKKQHPKRTPEEIKQYAKDYYKKNRVRIIKYHTEYVSRPEVKERLYQNKIKKLMAKYQITEEEAILVDKCRKMLYHIPAKLVLQLHDEMYQTEGANFTEMCMDGIPERKKQKMDVEQMSV